MKVTFVQSEGPSLAIEYLSSVLKSREHETSLVFDPRLFDSASLNNRFLRDFFDIKLQLVEKIAVEKPDLIGFSAFTSNYQWALQLASLIKRKLNTPIIFGGVHPTLVPELVIENDCVDMVCVGEGEYALLEVVESLEGQQRYDVKNIWFKRDGKIIRNEIRPLITDLDSLPFPDKDLIYHQQPLLGNDYLILPSRGCPYSCTFCCNSTLRKVYAGKGRYMRRRSVRNVMDELLWMKGRYRPKRVSMPDDIFTSDKRWIREFTARYKQEIGLPFVCVTHVNFFDLEIATLLKEAGCFWVIIGVQSVSESTRRDILRRPEKNERIMEAARHCHKAGLPFSVDHIFNIPFEGEKEQIDALSFYNELRPSVINTYWLKYYPRNEIVQIAREAGILDEEAIKGINEGKASTSPVIGIGAKDTFNPERKFYNFAFLMTILPLVSKRLFAKVIERRWYFDSSWKFPLVVNVLIKFIARLRIRQAYLYFDEIRILLYNLLKNLKTRYCARR